MLAIYGGPRVHENPEPGCASGDCQGSGHTASQLPAPQVPQAETSAITPKGAPSTTRDTGMENQSPQNILEGQADHKQGRNSQCF